MGEEKLDNAVYTIRGYADLADMARARGDDQTRRWAVRKARALLEKFEDDLVVRRRHPTRTRTRWTTRATRRSSSGTGSA